MRANGAGAAPLALARTLGPASARPWLILQFRPGRGRARGVGSGIGAVPVAAGSLSLSSRRPPPLPGRRSLGVSMGSAGDTEEGQNPERGESRTQSVSVSSPEQKQGPGRGRPPAEPDEHAVMHESRSRPGRKSSPQWGAAESKGGGQAGKGAGSRGNPGVGKGSWQGPTQASETRARSSYWLPAPYLWLTSKDKGGWRWEGASQPNSKPPPTLTAQGWGNILLQNDPADALRELSWRSMLKNESGEYVHPDLDWLRDMVEIRYGDRRDLDMRKSRGTGKVLINHVIQVVRQTPRRLRVRWAALLHDVGKPATVELDGERANKLTFHRHEAVGATMVGSILSRYGYDLKFQREVAALVLRSGRIRMVDKFNDQGARRLISVSGPLFTDLVDLYLADCTSASSKKQQEHHDRGVMLTKLVEDVLFRDRSRSKRPPINGHDVMALTGLKGGLVLGRLMRLLRKDYLLRGPFSKEEAIHVVSRLHEECTKNPEPSGPKRKGSSEEPSGPKKKCASEDEIIQTLKDSYNDSTGVLVFRVQLEQHGNGKSPVDPPEVFRDVIVHRKMPLFDFALMVAHAFDFDFDDKFSFYRRRQGTVCPGASAAFSGISEALVPHRAGHPPDKASASVDLGVGAEGDSEQLGGAGPEYELLASTTGIPTDLEIGGLAYSYDVRYSEELGLWVNPQGLPLQHDEQGSPASASDASPGAAPGRADAASALPKGGAVLDALSAGGLAGEDETRDLGDDEAFWNRKADTLAYPLKIPQKGQYIGSLFDRSRRSMLLVLECGGPWRFTIDFIQSREKKEYESPPRVIARMGYAPKQYVFQGKASDRPGAGAVA